MSIIKDTFFGGAEKQAATAQTKALEQAQTFTREGVAQARGDIQELFPQAQQDLQQGFQGALDVFAQTIPQQTAAFAGGNVAAQQALLAGLPQQQAAILGGQAALQPLNIQPFQFQPDLSFAQQTLPQIQQAQEQEALAAIAAQQEADNTAASMGTGFTPFTLDNNFNRFNNPTNNFGGNANFFNRTQLR